MLGVVPGEEDVTVPAGVLDRAEALRELSPREVAAVPAPPTPGVAFARRGLLPSQRDGDNYQYLPAAGRLVALDRGWHIALTPLRASAIRDYLDVRAMNGCPAKAVGSIAGDADKALGHGLAPSRGRTSGDRRGRGRATPAHGIPSRLLRRITCAAKLGSRALVLLSACGAVRNR